MTFKRTTKPPQGETIPENAVPSARMNKPIPQTRTTTPIHTATIDKPIVNTLTPMGAEKYPHQKIPSPQLMNLDVSHKDSKMAE